MARTKLSSLTHEELLQSIDYVRRYSPVIDELATRLEAKEFVDTDTKHNVLCPICQGQLHIDFDTPNNTFEVTIQTD